MEKLVDKILEEKNKYIKEMELTKNIAETLLSKGYFLGGETFSGVGTKTLKKVNLQKLEKGFIYICSGKKPEEFKPDMLDRIFNFGRKKGIHIGTLYYGKGNFDGVKTSQKNWVLNIYEKKIAEEFYKDIKEISKKFGAKLDGNITYYPSHLVRGGLH